MTMKLHSHEVWLEPIQLKCPIRTERDCAEFNKKLCWSDFSKVKKILGTDHGFGQKLVGTRYHLKTFQVLGTKYNK